MIGGDALTVRWRRFAYRDFYDFPRLILVEDQGRTYLMRCAFSPEADEYSDYYDIFVLPRQIADQLVNAGTKALHNGLVTQSWIGVESSGTHLGRLRVKSLQFDPTRRSMLDASAIDQVDQEP